MPQNSTDGQSCNPSRQEDGQQSQVSDWIAGVEGGDENAIAELWQYCFPQLLSYARNRLPEHLRRVLDEEDVALSTFKSFCMRAADGSLGEISGRDALWKLLYTIASRKALGYVRHQTREKRGGGNVGGESTFLKGGRFNGETIGDLPDQTAATPAMLAEFQNSCQHLLDQLEDSNLETIAVLRLEGYSVDEIAVRVGCAKRSVERRLRLIRTIWQSN